jgi:hypothetical protein
MSNRWVVLAILTMAQTAMGFKFQAVGSASPYLVDVLGVDYATIGFHVGHYRRPGADPRFASPVAPV